MKRKRHGPGDFEKAIEVLHDQERNAFQNAERRKKAAELLVQLLEDGKWYAEQYREEASAS